MRKTSSERQCNIYYDIYLREMKDARIFSREISWDIMNVVRHAGARGTTAREIRDEFRLTPKGVKPVRYKYPMSTIYQALDNLEQTDWIRGTTRPTLPWGRPPRGESKRIGRNQERGGRPLKIYTFGLHLSPTIIVEDWFYEGIEPILKKYMPEIKKAWVEILQKIIDEMSNKDLKGFLPQDEIQECGFSHEGYEFITAISLGILNALEEEEEWKDFAKRNNIMKRE